MYLNETYHDYLLPRPREPDGISKVVGSEFKVTDVFRKCTFPVEAGYR